MKLNELSAPKPSKQIAKVFESYFGSRLSFDQLNRRQTGYMLQRVRGILGEHRNSTARHRSEQNPDYLKLMMMEQALASRLSEMTPPPAPGNQGGTATGATGATGSTGSTAPVDPKLAAAQDKIKKGQTLSPEEQKMVNDNAAAVTENKLRRAYRMLKESEVQQAQVVLAAQDMVDKMQSMLEDVSSLQFKELPALVDSIKNQVGIDQATQFNTDATAALTGLMQNLQGAKQQLDAALNVVTGAAPAAVPGVDAATMPGAEAGAEMGAELGAEAGADLGADAGAELGADLEAGAEPAAALGSAQSLGRARK
jgi:hypothetical protein